MIMDTQRPDGQQRDESFRDSIATVDKRGKRVWIYPKKPAGKWFNKRALVGYGLLVFLFLGPFLRIGGEPLLQIDLLERRFVIFGQTFWPQDIHLFVLAFIAGVIFIALFTVVFGRLFCGWVCPQTVFMELVYRRIEYWIEGDWKQQQALNKGPWNADKVIRKTVKHILFFAIAFLIGNTFLAYIVGSDALIEIITSPPAEHLGGFVAMLVFSFLFYGVFAFLREQVCTTMCPYGRLQGVLLDRQSLVVAYDHVRGEGRAKFRKGEDRAATGKGDCIDCKACVHVCPTGIDIRNGTQLECVNCTACIDACNHMMESVDLPKGLIRFASETQISEKQPWRYTTRMKAYTAVLSVLVAVIVTLIVMRSDVEATVLRTPGMLFQRTEDGRISNLYNFKVVNKTSRDLPLEFRLEGVKGEIKLVGKEVFLEKAALGQGALFIVLDPEEVKGTKTKLTIGVYSGDRRIEEVNTTFVGPIRSAS
jgi:cytochrome c oxidase accessory protein FixG